MVEPAQDNHPQMSDLPVEEYTPLFYQPEELVEGEVVRIDEDGIVVSVGLKTEATEESKSYASKILGNRVLTPLAMVLL